MLFDFLHSPFAGCLPCCLACLPDALLACLMPYLLAWVLTAYCQPFSHLPCLACQGLPDVLPDCSLPAVFVLMNCSCPKKHVI